MRPFTMERYRIHSEGAVYFVTYSIVDWLPVFVADEAFKIVTDSLTFCHRQKHLRILAYVIMPTHFHAVVFDEQFDTERLADALTAFRKFTGRQIVDHCRRHAPACFLEAFGEAAGDDREHRVWQPTRHPVVIATQDLCEQKVNYIHENPCRKGLVRRAADWRYSSAAYWLSEAAVASEVPLTPIVW